MRIKKITLVCVLFLSMILMIACSSKEDLSSEVVTHLKDVEISEYFPFHPDTILTYEGKGSEYADQVVFFDYQEDSKIQRRVQTTGTTMGQVIQVEDEKIVISNEQEEFYSFFPLLRETPNSSEVLLMKPLSVGTEWKLDDGRKRSITKVQAQISVPYGDFEAIEVTTELEDAVHRSYYVKGIGFVKGILESENGVEPITTVLVSMEENASWETNLRVYFPEWEEQQSVYKDFTVSLATNESIEAVLTKYLQQQPDMNTAAAVLQENIVIQNIERKPEEHLVKVDFNSELIEVGMGSDFESQMLQCIVNTVGEYYGVNRVLITVEGGPYETGHYYLGPDDYLVPDTANAKKI